MIDGGRLSFSRPAVPGQLSCARGSTVEGEVLPRVIVGRRLLRSPSYAHDAGAPGQAPVPTRDGRSPCQTCERSRSLTS